MKGKGRGMCKFWANTMSKIVMFLVLLSISTLGAGCNDEERISPNKAVGTLNTQSHHFLGLSLPALFRITDVGEDQMLSVYALERSGTYKYVRELESAGYVVIHEGEIRSGDGPAEAVITLIPTERGKELLSAIRALER